MHVCMCDSVCLRVCVYPLYEHACLYMCVHICMHVCLCLGECKLIHMFAYVCASVFGAYSKILDQEIDL